MGKIPDRPLVGGKGDGKDSRTPDRRGKGGGDGKDSRPPDRRGEG